MDNAYQLWIHNMYYIDYWQEEKASFGQRISGEIYRKLCGAARISFEWESEAVAIEDFLYQSKPYSLTVIFGAEKRRKKVFLVFIGYPDTGVLDNDMIIAIVF